MSRSLAGWFISDEDLVPAYAEYGKHTMVADENWFATLLKNSPWCGDHENDNLVAVQFDQWEHDKVTRVNDRTKCLQPNPNHCGRSPTINTIEYLPALELSQQLFARKFDPSVDNTVLDALDFLRANGGAGSQKGAHFPGVVLEAKGAEGMCVKVGARPGNAVVLEGCNATTVTQVVQQGPCDPPSTRVISLAAALSPFATLLQAFEIGPCSADGDVTIGPDSTAVVTRGRFGQPFCSFKGWGNLCLDLEGEAVTPGTRIISWPCSPGAKWNQLLSFGPSGALFINVPFVNHLDKRLCISLQSVQRRGTRKYSLVASDCDPSDPKQRFGLRPVPRELPHPRLEELGHADTG